VRPVECLPGCCIIYILAVVAMVACIVGVGCSLLGSFMASPLCMCLLVIGCKNAASRCAVHGYSCLAAMVHGVLFVPGNFRNLYSLPCNMTVLLTVILLLSHRMLSSQDGGNA
jgi:hypothetical protein